MDRKSLWKFPSKSTSSYFFYRLFFIFGVSFLFFNLTTNLYANTNPASKPIDLYNGIPPQKFLTGNFDYKNHPSFDRIPKNHLKRNTYKTIYLRKEVIAAFLKMAEAARRDGIKLVVVSGFRSFDHQKRIWNRKFKQLTPVHPKVKTRVKEILKYSSLPGTSRHHWGTDLDLNSLNNRYFTHHKYGRKVKEWLDKNAEKYGFYLTYTPSFERSGYNTEYWHYTYYPSSSKIMHHFLIHINPNSLQIFREQNNIDLQKIFRDYVLGIDNKILRKMQLDGISIDIRP